jgi:ComF family protein
MRALAALTAIRKIPAALFSFAFPDECRICDAPLTELSRIPVCSRCLNKPKPLSAEYACARCQTPFLNRFPLDEQGLCTVCRLGAQTYDACFSFGSFEDELRDLIHLLKYGRVQTVAKPLGKLLSAVLPRDQVFDAIVPMPLHWRKRWQRGFNQAELLAQELSRRTGIPVRKLVCRIKNTSAQAGLTSAKRRANMSMAFRTTRSLDGQRLILLDDVLTTGSTAASCARALKRAGASYVAMVTVARVDRRTTAVPVHQSNTHLDISSLDSIFPGSSKYAQSGSTT